jgi:alanine racemase
VWGVYGRRAASHNHPMTMLEPTLQPAAPAAVVTPSEAEAGGVLTIDLAAIEANWRRLYGMTVPVECSAVVKADAYGCGLERVVPRLLKGGCKTFFVADVGEGRKVRALAPDAVIYVLNGVLPNTAPALANLNLRPVINSTTELAEWDTFVSANSWRGGAALHIDTGMNRLGLTPDEAVAIAHRAKSDSHGLTLVISHLACADTPDHPMNDRQMRLFREIRILYRGIPSSLANSAGIFLGGTAHCDLVRPGIALFGANPMPGRPNPMRPVVELKGRVIQVRPVKRGDTAGYGAAWTAGRPGRLAIVAVGYGDGYPRAAGAAKGKNPGQVILAGKRCPIVGRVSMDLIAVDVTDLPQGQPRRGDLATLIGGDLTVDEVAAACGTIGYEMLTNLGKRYHRIYKD